MKINNEYNVKDLVFLITDPEQNSYHVTGIVVRDAGIFYELRCGTETSEHEAYEISQTRAII